jgi:hypothetical protein
LGAGLGISLGIGLGAESSPKISPSPFLLTCNKCAQILEYAAKKAPFLLQNGFAKRFLPLQGEAMFPEYRDLISQLKGKDYHFTRIFDQHNALDHQIQSLEAKLLPGGEQEVDRLKKEKLKLKDELGQILKKASANAKA